MQPPPGLAAVLACAACALAAALASCGGGGACAEAPPTAEAAASLAAIEREAPFAPTRPCAFGPRFEVTRAFADALPEGGARWPRVHYELSRDGETVYVLTQTEAIAPFRAIPLGSSRLRVDAGGLVAEGFAGPSGAGGEVAYLRWRAGGVTHELFATLRPWFAVGDARAVAAALMRRAAAGRRVLRRKRLKPLRRASGVLYSRYPARGQSSPPSTALGR